MKIFVTGGTGFIGSHLIEYFLKQRKADIYALVRNPAKLKWLEGLDVNILEGDLFSIPALPEDLDFVFHIAGLSKANRSADYYTVNQEGTASVFQAFDSQGINPKKVVCLSSLAASGPCQGGQPVKETAKPRPISTYGKSKLKGEEEALKFKERFPLVIIRVGAVFGPRDKDFIPYFKMIKKSLLPSLASYPRQLSFCYVKDLVHALDLTIQKDLESGEILHIADHQPYSWDEFGKTAGEALGVKLKKIKIPLPAIYVAALVSDMASRIRKSPHILNKDKYQEIKQSGWVADTENSIQILGFRPQYTLFEALTETLDWYLQKNWL